VSSYSNWNWNVALRLGRVSNLPTVTSNVLAGIVLAGAQPSLSRAAVVCLAMSMMYVAGMYLNDAFDRDIDRLERPERPIPSGQVTALAVFQVGFALLLGGVLAITLLALTTGVGWKAVATSGGLALLIVLYDAKHKGNPASPLIMGMCRASVYLTAALAVSSSLPTAVLVGSGLLVAYLIGLTYIARAENLRDIGKLWPLAFLGAPFVVAFPNSWPSAGCYVLLALIVTYALLLIRARQIRSAVVTLIAGISVLDALIIAREGRPSLALVAIGCWFATRWLQRIVPGT
jgi:hypothetical protein